MDGLTLQVHGRQDTLSTEGAIAATVWLAHILAVPLYLLPASMPQPADFLLVFIGLLLLAWNRIQVPVQTAGALQIFAVFVVYCAIVQLAWLIILRDPRFLLPPLFLLYNWCACVIFLSLYCWFGLSFLRWTAICIFLAVFFQFAVGMQLLGSQLSQGMRATLFFRNPNQTAHYAVLCGTIILVCSSYRLLPGVLSILEIPFYGGLFYLTAASQSRAGLASVAMLLGLRTIRGVVGLVSVLFILAFVNYTETGQFLFHRFFQRLESKHTSFQDEMYGRGYARIMRHPQYLVFGAGEGAYERFEVLRGHELHSTLANVLMSYGVIGFALFSAFWITVLRRVGLASVLWVLPVFAFGMTHNGIRHTEFWLLPFMMLCARLGEPYAVPSGQCLGSECCGTQGYVLSSLQKARW